MILNLKDLELNNYVSWVYSTLLAEIEKDTGWVSLELLNGVERFTEGYDLQVRRIRNTVYMRGRITNLTEKPITIAIMPEQFRPRDGYSFRFVVPSNGGTNAVFVFNPTSGMIILDFTSDGELPAERWFSFNNVVFCTD